MNKTDHVLGVSQVVATPRVGHESFAGRHESFGFSTDLRSIRVAGPYPAVHRTLSHPGRRPLGQRQTPPASSQVETHKCKA